MGRLQTTSGLFPWTLSSSVCLPPEAGFSSCGSDRQLPLDSLASEVSAPAVIAAVLGLLLQHLLLVAERCGRAQLCPRYGSWCGFWPPGSPALCRQEDRALVPVCPWWGCCPEPGACGGSWEACGSFVTRGRVGCCLPSSLLPYTSSFFSSSSSLPLIAERLLMQLKQDVSAASTLTSTLLALLCLLGRGGGRAAPQPGGTATAACWPPRGSPAGSRSCSLCCSDGAETGLPVVFPASHSLRRGFHPCTLGVLVPGSPRAASSLLPVSHPLSSPRRCPSNAGVWYFVSTTEMWISALIHPSSPVLVLAGFASARV